MWSVFHTGRARKASRRYRLLEARTPTGAQTAKSCSTSTQAAGRSSGAWIELIGSDRMFDQHIEAAYAESWAFSFFLSETQPRKYQQLLARTAARPDFKPYPSAQRLADFKAIFGDNLPLLEADFLRFISAIR